MAPIKCVGCFDLLREELEIKGKKMVVYNCPRYFPYACALSGLLCPGIGIVEAVKDCPEKTDLNCIIKGCLHLDLTYYGSDKMIFICKAHDKAWGEWLDRYPGKRDYFAPRGRAIRSRYIEIFREFIEDGRVKVDAVS